MYDSGAIKVLNASKQRVGYITSKVAYPFSETLDRLARVLKSRGERIVMKGIILDVGDGQKQTLRIVLRRDVKTLRSGAKAAAASDNASTGMAS